MDFLELARSRYSVRKFSDKKVEQEKLNLILEAGRISPTASNFQPQRILVLNSEDSLNKLKDYTIFHFNAPLALLVCYEKNADWQRKFDGKKSGDIDASIVATHMMLEAANIGLGSTWVMSFDPQKARETYNIPDNLEPVVLLVMGYPAADAVPSKGHEQRVPIDNTVFYNDFSKWEPKKIDEATNHN